MSIMCSKALVCAHIYLIYVKKASFFSLFRYKDLVEYRNRRTFASSIRQKVIRFLG